MKRFIACILLLLAALPTLVACSNVISNDAPLYTYPPVEKLDYVDWQTAYSAARSVVYCSSGLDIDNATAEIFSYMKNMNTWTLVAVFGEDSNGLSVSFAISATDSSSIYYEQSKSTDLDMQQTPPTVFKMSDIMETAAAYAAVNYKIELNESYVYTTRSLQNNIIKVYYDAYPPQLYAEHPLSNSPYFSGVILEYDLDTGELVHEERYEHTRDSRVVERLTDAGQRYFNGLINYLTEYAVKQPGNSVAMTYSELKDHISYSSNYDVLRNILVGVAAEDAPSNIEITVDDENYTVTFIYAATEFDGCNELKIVCTSDADYAYGELLFGDVGYYWYAIAA